jgi:hypothetical protein
MLECFLLKCYVQYGELKLLNLPLYIGNLSSGFSTVFGEEKTGFSQRIRHVLIGHAVNTYIPSFIACDPLLVLTGPAAYQGGTALILL